MDIVGYCLIKKEASTGISAVSLDEYRGKICRVFEFASDGGVLIINPKGTALASFDKCDIVSKFECTEIGDIIIPPNLNFLEQLAYSTKAMMRKGGYNYIVKQMIISASIHRGEFCDSLLWTNQ